MESKMIALENHIEKENAQEKSIVPLMPHTADGHMPSSEISKEIESAKIDIESHIGSGNVENIPEAHIAAGHVMVKEIITPEKEKLKPPIIFTHVIKKALVELTTTEHRVDKAEVPSTPIKLEMPRHAHTTTAPTKKSSLSDAAAPSPSLESMEREVIELEKQIQRHMAAREQALAKVAVATSKCHPADAACGQAKDQIHWKISQDKYEQAAMKDILKQDRENSTQEGQALFHHYASQAEQLSGIRPLASLNNRTAALVREHIRAEHLSLRELRAAEDRLDRLKMAERRMLDAKQAALDRAAISRAQRHIKRETELMTGPREPRPAAPGAPVPLQHRGAGKASAAPPSCRYNCEPAAAAAAQLEPGIGVGGAAGPAAVAAAYDADAAAEGASPPLPSQQQRNPYAAQSLTDSAPLGSDAQAAPCAGSSTVASASAAPVEGAAAAPASAAAANGGGGELSDEAYRRDFAQAQTVEVLRRKAFVLMEQQQKAKVGDCGFGHHSDRREVGRGGGVVVGSG